MTCRNWESGVLFPVPQCDEETGRGTDSLEGFFDKEVPVPMVYPAVAYGSQGEQGNGESAALPWLFLGA